MNEYKALTERRQALITVTVHELSSAIPESEIDSFKEWSIYKAKNLGQGFHYESYAYSEDFEKDISCKLHVSILFVEQ